MVLANELTGEVGRKCCTHGGNLEEREQMEEKSKLYIANSVHGA